MCVIIRYNIVGCNDDHPDTTDCSSDSFSVSRGDDTEWRCVVTAAPGSNFTLLFKQTSVMPSNKSTECKDERPQIIFIVEEQPQHFCYSQFVLTTIICSASESVMGTFSIANSNGDLMDGGTVDVKLTGQSSTFCCISCS